MAEIPLVSQELRPWKKSCHDLSCQTTKKIIETMLILNLKDKEKNPKYGESLVCLLAKETLVEIFEYLPLDPIRDELLNKLEKLVDISDTKSEEALALYKKKDRFKLSSNESKFIEYRFPRYGIDNIDPIVEDYRYFGMQWMNISENFFTTIPSEINRLANLESINISKCYLTTLPEEFCDLSELKKLDLYENLLVELPRSFGKLKKLVKFRVWSNYLTELPESFGELESLKVLELQDNKIVKLCSNFGKLQILKELYIGNNKIKQFPREILECSKLKDLDISRNQMKSFPQELLKKKFRDFRFFGNQFIFGDSGAVVHFFEKEQNTMWKKDVHQYSSYSTRKIIETMLILKNKENREYKYNSLVSFLPKEILMEIFQYLPLFDQKEEKKGKKRKVSDHEHKASKSNGRKKSKDKV